MDLKQLADERLRQRDPLQGAEWLMLAVLAMGLLVIWLLT